MPEFSLPAISAIVPCWNAAATLQRAVDSILRDAPGNLELILVDDGSTDETPALCDKIAAQDRRVKVLHRKNGGASAARNAGLDAAAGEWILFVDADDCLLPGLWQALPPAFAARPQLILFGMERQSSPAPCPLAPGFYPTPADLGDAMDPLLFESGYLAAPISQTFLGRGHCAGRDFTLMNVSKSMRMSCSTQFFYKIPFPFSAYLVYTITNMMAKVGPCPAVCGMTCWMPRRSPPRHWRPCCAAGDMIRRLIWPKAGCAPA